MAARRSSNRKPGRGASPARDGGAPPGWLWMVAGLVGGFFVAFLVQLLRVQPDPAVNAASSPAAPAKAAEAKPAQANNAPKPRFDFYTLLPESETIIEDAPATAAKPAQPPAPPPAQKPTDKPASSVPATAQTAPATGPAATSPSAPAVAAAPTTPPPAQTPPPAPAEQPAAKGERLLLQAGAFRSRGDADKRRAEISFLGMSSSIQSVQRGNETWHRVLVGPFRSQEQMSAARARLQSSGIPSLMFKTKG